MLKKNYREIALITAGFIIIIFLFFVYMQSRDSSPKLPLLTSNVTTQITTSLISADSGIKTAVVPPQETTQQNSKLTALNDDSEIGSPKTRVTIIEFTDFQCPFCKTWSEKTFPAIKKKYLDTGKANYIVKDFPLSMHPQAILAAGAAYCAQKQDKYWPMHDKIYEGQSSWSIHPQAENIFSTYAGQIGLDIIQFKNCLQQKDYTEKITFDIKDGENHGVTAIPFFLINDKELKGAQKFEAFEKIIEQELTQNN